MEMLGVGDTGRGWDWEYWVWGCWKWGWEYWEWRLGNSGTEIGVGWKWGLLERGDTGSGDSGAGGAGSDGTGILELGRLGGTGAAGCWRCREVEPAVGEAPDGRSARSRRCWMVTTGRCWMVTSRRCRLLNPADVGSLRCCRWRRIRWIPSSGLPRGALIPSPGSGCWGGPVGAAHRGPLCGCAGCHQVPLCHRSVVLPGTAGTAPRGGGNEGGEGNDGGGTPRGVGGNGEGRVGGSTLHYQKGGSRMWCVLPGWDGGQEVTLV